MNDIVQPEADSTSIDLQTIDSQDARDEHEEEFQAAQSQDIAVHSLEDDAEFSTKSEDDDEPQLTQIVKRDGMYAYAAGCSCDYEGVCRHIFELLMADTIDDITIPHENDLTKDEIDVKRIDMSQEPDDDEEPEKQNGESQTESTAERAQDIESEREFVEEIAGVPPAFVVEMGHGRTSKPYITKEGLTYLAHQQDLQVRAEAVSPSWEEPEATVAYRGVVEDEDGNRWTDIGTAHSGREEMNGADENLDELASTRATNRALRLATGCGFASVEEIEGKSVVREQTGGME